MPIPGRPIIDIAGSGWSVLVTDDGSRTLIDPESRVAFHSGCGAVAETRSVYLGGSGLRERLLGGQPSSVLEIGVGLGLGLLMTLDVAKTQATPIRYVGIERAFLPNQILRRMRYDSVIDHGELFEQWLGWADPFCDPDQHVRTFRSGPAEVTLHRGELMSVIVQMDASFDAIYFDPFDPVTNPDLWSVDVMRQMAQRLRPGGRLATYCVRRSVRDAMTAAGLEVKKVPGPTGGKREVCVATRPRS